MPPKKSTKKSNFKKNVSNLIVISIIVLLCVAVWYYSIKQDGYFTEWNEWSKCDKTCGTDGIQIRTREYVPPKYWGNDDPDKDSNKLKETRSCIPAPPTNCPIDGSYGDWTEWTECDKSCGYGNQIRTRIYNNAKYGGKDIENIILSESKECFIKECSNLPADVTQWKDINPEEIYYHVNNNPRSQLLATKINNVSPLFANYVFFKQQERTFTKESSDYKGTKTLSNILTTELNNKRITQDEYNKLKEKGGIQRQNTEITDKKQIKYTAFKEKWTLLSDCTPRTGKVRNKTFITKYYAATGNNEQDQEFKLFSDRFLSLASNSSIIHKTTINEITITYNIKRINNTEPKIFEISKQELCEPIPTFSINEIQQIWKDTTGCNLTLTDETLSSGGYTNKINDYMYESDSTKFIQNIKSWARDGILNEKDINKRNIKLQQCYTPRNIYLNNVLESEEKGNSAIIYPGICYSGNHLWENSNIRLRFIDGILQFEILVKDGKYYWTWRSNNQIRNSNNILCMQNDGNLTILDSNGKIVWSSNTAGNNGAYAEINTKSGGFCIKNKDGKIIKYLLTRTNGTDNVYIGGNNNWKYVKNNSIKGLLSDWTYYDPNSKTYIKQSEKVTLANDTQPWGMTENATNSNERDDSDMIKPINLTDSSGGELGSYNIVHIVLLNRFGERIYIEPSVFQNILTKNDYKGDDNVDLGCDGDEYIPISTLRINYLIDKSSGLDVKDNIIAKSSNKLTDITFKNEWGRKYRDPFRFKKYQIYTDSTIDYPYSKMYDSGTGLDFGGAIHAKNTKYRIDGCTQFHNLYNDNRYVDIKKALKDDGFVNIKNSINDGKNWISYRLHPIFDRYYQYWRVYERSMENYVKYLNSSNHPESSSFNNKQISNFSNKIINTYLEIINI